MPDITAITAGLVYDHLTGGLCGERLYDSEGETVIGVLDIRYDTGLVHVNEPDVYPTRTLGRFRVTVEEVEG